MKTALITGSSRGIGAACAEYYAKNGYAVMIHYHTHQEEAEKLCQSILSSGGNAAVFQADVADENQAKALVFKTKELFGSVDVLVNNAGIALNKMFCDTSLSDWNKLLSVNLLGMVHTISAVLPDMVHRKAGHIVNLSSVWGITGASCEVAYSTTKAAVIGLTKSLAKELGPSGIYVNCVAPGVIDTDMNKNLDEESRQALLEETPLEKIGTPEDVAKAVYYLGNEENRFITGQVLSPNGGFLI
ncbi:MAG: 3-oxoacyl-ACP reductase FabG [Clostridia bacterium]|nr:3-oxoacyl-ACP reductase FabG [Clostridia bacterium]